MQPVKPSFHPSTAPQQQSAPVQHTQNPKIVGTSVLGMKYKDGIVLAADNLGRPPKAISFCIFPSSLTRIS